MMNYEIYIKRMFDLRIMQNYKNKIQNIKICVETRHALLLRLNILYNFINMLLFNPIRGWKCFFVFHRLKPVAIHVKPYRADLRTSQSFLTTDNTDFHGGFYE